MAVSEAELAGQANLWADFQLSFCLLEYSKASYADLVVVREVLQSSLSDKLQHGRSGKHFVSVRQWEGFLGRMWGPCL